MPKVTLEEVNRTTAGFLAREARIERLPNETDESLLARIWLTQWVKGEDDKTLKYIRSHRRKKGDGGCSIV